MSIDACIAEIEKAAGRQLDDAERGDLAEKMSRIVRKVRNTDVADTEAAILKATDDFAEEMVTAAVIEKRNAALNLRARLQMADYLRSTWDDAPGTGLEAFLGGVNINRAGARASVASEQESLFSYYTTSMGADLERARVHEFAASGKFDEEIWKAVWELNMPEPDAARLKALPKEAVETAKIINKYNEMARIDANHAGAWIKKIPGYVTKRTHDQARIAKAAGGSVPLDDQRHFQTWKDDVLQWLDLERTLPDAADPERALKEMFNDFASGVHVKFQEGGVSGFKGFANVGKRMSQERVLHFKSPEAEYAYHRKYGSGTLMENVMYGLEHMARDTALMRHLGPNAEMNLDEVVNGVLKRLKQGDNPSQQAAFARKAAKIKETLWPNITGEARIAGNAQAAAVSASVRAVEQMADLGMATLSAVSDIAFVGSEYRFQGEGMLRGVNEALRAIFQGKVGLERKEVLGELGVFIDSMRASIASRFDVSDDLPGRVAKANQIYFKFNLLRKWTDNQRGAFALAASHRLAVRAEQSLDQLPEGLQRMLRTFGIDEGKWDLYRQGKTKLADGRDYLTPEGLDAVPDAAFSAYLSERGQTPTPARVRQLREETKGQFRSYFFDRSTTAVLEPDKKTRAILLQGTKPGTVVGETLRHFMLYKSFMASVLQKVIGRELYGYSDSALPLGKQLWKVLKDPGGSEMRGIANVIAFSAVGGYGAMALKDLAKGREPRVPDDPASGAKIFTAALVQGGGLGIYGDFLFGEMKNRFGGGPLLTLAGPTARRFNDVWDLYSRFVTGDDTAAQAFRIALSNTPGNNLFYAKLGMDYLVVNRLQEMANPGYLRRMERRIQRENDQAFILPPSQYAQFGQ